MKFASKLNLYQNMVFIPQLNKNLRHEKICTMKWKYIGNMYNGWARLPYVHWYEVSDSCAISEP